MAAEDENKNDDETEQKQPDEAAEAENAPEVESGGDDPLTHIDSTKGQRSKTKTVKDGIDEAGMLLQAGWKPFGPYLHVKPPDKPFMTLKAPNGVGKVFYTMGKNMTRRRPSRSCPFTRSCILNLI